MSKRILIVEDSPTQALRAQVLLEEAGYQVEIAENGKVGLEKALADPPDLVVADIIMPVVDGYEMTRRLKADQRTAMVPVLMLTTKDQPLDVVRGLEVGADHFITKPYEDDYLVERVRALFDQLEEGRGGRLPEQQELERLDQVILVTKNREQVLQTLLQATARVLDCQAMALLLHHTDGDRPLFIMSFSPLDSETVERLRVKIVEALNWITTDLPATMPTETRQIVVESARPSFPLEGDLLQSFLHAPLIVDGRVTGVVSIFSTLSDAFGVQHIRFLFDMGQKAAQALSRLKA